MKEDDRAAKHALLDLQNVLVDSSCTTSPHEVAELSPGWEETSRMAIAVIDGYLSSEPRRFGVGDDEDLRALFLGGDEFVAVMNRGQLTLRTDVNFDEQFVTFDGDEDSCERWLKLFR